MIFFNLNLEKIVQVSDQTRFIASNTFVSPDEGAITLLRISPDNGATWYDITGVDKDLWFLDWEYEVAGTKTVKLEVTTTNSAATEKDFTLELIAEADDLLFSNDDDLVKMEPEILCFLRRGRASFLDIHRCAQKIIMDWLAMQIKVKDCDISTSDGCVTRKIEKKDLWDVEEVRTWSAYQTLVLIFEGLSNQKDDIFSQKAVRYSELMRAARSRSEVTTDFDQDGTADYREQVRTSFMSRRG